MKKFFLIALFAFALVSLAGCGRHYVMEGQDMYTAPSLAEMPEKITVVAFKLDPVLDLAEGGDGRFSWRAVMWNAAGEEHNLLALSLNYSGARQKVLLIAVPQSLAEVTGNYLAVFDHGGKRVYNHLGQCRELDSLAKKIEVGKYKNFLTEIKAGEFTKEIGRGSAEYEGLLQLYREFRIQELDLVRKYIYTKHGSNLTAEQLKKIASDDSVVTSFVDWLGRDWKAYLTYPFMGIEATGLIAGVVKVFTFPSIWGDKINRPGYMEYVGDSEHIAKMILRGVQNYGGATIIAENNPLPKNLRERIKERTGKDFATYEDYNLWVVEENKKKK